MSESLSGDATMQLPEFDAPPPRPLPLFGDWMARAEERQVREPRAGVLSTVSSAGRPSSRVLLMKSIDERGLLFTTSSTSRKGRELEENPVASLNFYWRELLQQVEVSGRVEMLSPEDADVLFDERPPAARATTIASVQSAQLESMEGLRRHAAELLEDTSLLIRPKSWSAYRLVPDIFEFWYGSPDRLHRRIRYDESKDGTWISKLLQP